MALDYGEKTVGVAVSDELRLCAFGVEIIRRDNEVSLKKTIARLKELIQEYSAATLVLGYPKKQDNTISLRCEKTLEFKERLHRNFKTPDIILWDERYSTIGAARTLTEAGLSNRKKESVIDEMAAVFILQGYLEYLKISN